MILASAASPAIIWASKDNDPGLQDQYGNFRALMLAHGDEAMSNVEYLPNTGQMPTYFEGHPPAEPLAEYSAGWTLAGQHRTFCLIVEDMEKDYAAYIDFVLPNAVSLLAKFREVGQPVVWTNWNRQEDDGAYGAIDRFYGPQGIYPPNGTAVFGGHYENPMWIDTRSEPLGTDTVDVLKPQTPEEESLTIKSMHLSKFADKYADGSDVLYPMLKAWGVDTVVVIGAWTEDCITATAFEASDRYGLDVVIIPDALATATPAHPKAIDVMAASCAKSVTTAEMIDYLGSDAASLKPPLKPLSYAAVAPAALASEPPAASTAPSSAVPLPAALVLAAACSVVSALLGALVATRAAAARSAAADAQPLV